VVLPEAALTGYVSPKGKFDATPFAEDLDGGIVRRASEIARARNLHLVAPLVLREGKRFFNSVVVVSPSGDRIAVYRKRHPWFPETWATPGPEPHPLFRIGDVRVTIAICFDGHFLSEEAADTLRAADLLVFPSAWVDDDERARERLLVALARDFHVAIANANWAPGVVRVRGQGGSVVIDPSGAPLVRVGRRELRADAWLSVSPAQRR
jgi:predicted amidohydrolase